MLLCTKSPYPEKPLTPYSTLIPAPMPSLVCCLCAWLQLCQKAFGSQLRYICPVNLLSLIDFLLNLNMRKSMIGLLLALQAVLFINNKVSAQGTWSNLDGGIQHGAEVFSICPDTINNILYVGGAFDTVASFPQIAFAKWNGIRWDSTVKFSDKNTQVNALIMFKGQLYVGFNNGQVGVYDGTTLNYISSFNDAVYCFCIYNDTLYVGGQFGGTGGLNNIAKWNGNIWLPVDKGMSWNYCCPSVSAMTVFNGQLIAAGTFDSAGEVSASSIASYSGTKWSPLGGGIISGTSIGYVNALEVYKNNLYAGGICSYADSIPVNNIAVWNGALWDSMQETPQTYIWALKSFDGYLFMGTLEGYAKQYIYKYDGSVISTVDSGANSDVYSLNQWRDSLFVGGVFYIANKAITVNSIARWTPNSTTTGINEMPDLIENVSVYPNPLSEETMISFSPPVKGNAQLNITDLVGREINTFSLSNGTKSISFKRGNLPAGIYFYKLILNQNQTATGKIIME